MEWMEMPCTIHLKGSPRSDAGFRDFRFYYFVTVLFVIVFESGLAIIMVTRPEIINLMPSNP